MMSVEAVRQRVAELTQLVSGPPAALLKSRTPAVAFQAALQRAAQQHVEPAAQPVFYAGTYPVLSRGSNPSRFDEYVQAAAQRTGLDARLINAVIEQESGFDPLATSPAGAKGLMQLMPATARSLGVTDPYDPAQSIDAGSRYLAAQMRRFGDIRLALAAYNAGPGAVAKYDSVPPYAETQNYVSSVLARYTRIEG